MVHDIHCVRQEQFPSQKNTTKAPQGRVSSGIRRSNSVERRRLRAILPPPKSPRKNDKRKIFLRIFKSIAHFFPFVLFVNRAAFRVFKAANWNAFSKGTTNLLLAPFLAGGRTTRHEPWRTKDRSRKRSRQRLRQTTRAKGRKRPRHSVQKEN